MQSKAISLLARRERLARVKPQGNHYFCFFSPATPRPALPYPQRRNKESTKGRVSTSKVNDAPSRQ